MRERLMPRPTVDGGRDRQVASESQDRFRAVIEALPDPFAIHSAVRDETGRIVDFRFEYVNAATVAFNGLSAEAQVGHRLLELFPALLGSALFDAFVRVVETGEPLAMESVGYVDAAAAGGPIRSVLDVRAVKFGDGYAVASRELTARARAEQALRDSEALLRAFFDSPGAMRSIVDLVDERIVHVADNPEAVAFFAAAGRSTHDGSASGRRIAGQVLQLYRTHYEEARRTGQPVQFDYERETPGGARWLRALVSYVGITQGGHHRFASLVTDITHAVEMQAALGHANRELQRSMSLLSAIIDGASDHIHVKDLEGRYVLVNRADAGWFERAAADIIGRTDAELTDPQESARVIEIDRGVIESGRPLSYEQEATIDGVTRTWLTTKDVVRDAAGGVTGVFAISREITEQRRHEAHLRQVAKMEAVGQLAGGVAHDFNNMLTAIRGYTEFVQAHLPAEFTQDQEDLAEVVRVADRAAGLTRQLLAFSRRQVLQPEIIDPAQVVGAISPMLGRLLCEHVEFVMRAEPDPGLVRVDPGQLEQVIVNLGVNARDAMPDGGILTIETSSVEVGADLTGTQPDVIPGPYVLLSVSDTGVGMDPETQARIFEPFFTTKEPGKGTGMGLATVYGIVRQSGGFISVESDLGQGTTFRIYLPREIEEPASVVPVFSEPRPSSGSETILLVEDEQAVRSFARRALEQHGYSVLEAADGAQALLLAAAHVTPIDLLVTDVTMPGLQGHQLAQQLTAGHPGLRVLYISGFAEEAVNARVMLGGGVAFLAKPFGADELCRRVRGALDGRP